MGEDNVQLHSLTFKKVHSDVISSVCCTLTNGESSGTIEDQSIEHEAEETIVFDPETLRKVRSVEAVDEGQRWIARLRFYDAEGIELCSFNPQQSEDKGDRYELTANEELIGVYGANQD